MHFKSLCTFTFLLSLLSTITFAQPLSRDPAKLDLASVNAMVYDLETGTELYSKNPDLAVPIASITKLMVALVTLDANLPMNEKITVEIKDVKEMKNVYSRVRIGSEITRKEMLRLALMSSENRAAASLAHHYPGGVPAFIKAMNDKAKALGMTKSKFVEPTGLSSGNISTARDLTKLLVAASKNPVIKEMTTTPNRQAAFTKPSYSLPFNNTNLLVRKQEWTIDVSKTGFTNAAGRCLVMVAEMANRKVAMVFLDSLGDLTPVGDASRVRKWVETGTSTPVPAEAKAYEQKKQKEVVRVAKI